MEDSRKSNYHVDFGSDKEIQSITRTWFFDKIVLDTFDYTKKVFSKKSNEYSFENAPFHNFESGVGHYGFQTREQVLAGYKLKHDISIQDMIHSASNTRYSKEFIDEKIGDSINYLLLLKGMLYERNSIF